MSRADALELRANGVFFLQRAAGLKCGDELLLVGGFSGERADERLGKQDRADGESS